MNATAGHAEITAPSSPSTGFEVKAGSRFQDTALSGLRLLRDRLVP